MVKLGPRVLGRAPINLRFSPGITYELTFVKSGYQSTKKRFTASGRKGQRVNASLKKRPHQPEASELLPAPVRPLTINRARDPQRGTSRPSCRR